jgi:hypothetical protein
MQGAAQVIRAPGALTKRVTAAAGRGSRAALSQHAWSFSFPLLAVLLVPVAAIAVVLLAVYKSLRDAASMRGWV